MRKKIVAGNWKMNMDYQAGIELLSEAANMIKNELHTEVDTVFATPFIHLRSVAQLLKNENKLFLAAQNCHQEKAGAYTGEISASMLHSVGVNYVIIGHSERRNYFKEDHATLAKKVDEAVSNYLMPIFCIGETLEERNANTYFDLLKKQLQESVFHLQENDFKKCVIAYEPVWAIGTGLTANPGQAQEVHAYIRKLIAEQYSENTAALSTILYGGSCNAKNAYDLFSQKDIDGGLIGGASLKSREFADIVCTFNRIR